MNKKLVTTLFIFIFPLAAYALDVQQGEPAAHSTALRGERDQLEKELGMNEEQRANVETIINEESSRFKALKFEKSARLQAMSKPELLAKLDATNHKLSKLRKTALTISTRSYKHE